jgi:hypothetical protein
MKVKIMHSCGHEQEREVDENRGGIEKQIQRLKTGKCPKCWSSGMSQEAAQRNKANGLPALSGHPRQIAWAEVIREKAISENNLISVLERLSRDGITTGPLALETQRLIMATVESFRNMTDAGWWIGKELSGEAHDYVYRLIAASVGKAVPGSDGTLKFGSAPQKNAWRPI